MGDCTQKKKSEITLILMVYLPCIFPAEHDAGGRFTRLLLSFIMLISCLARKIHEKSPIRIKVYRLENFGGKKFVMKRISNL